MTRRLHNGQSTRFIWDAAGRLKEARSADTRTVYGYDPLGRRLFKRSSPIVVEQSGAGSKWHEAESRRLTQERGLGTTYYSWDGDQMVIETDYGKGQATHYVFEPNSFVPLLQASSRSQDPRSAYLRRPAQATSEYADADGNYDLDRDPLYNGSYEPGLNSAGDGPPPLENIHYYQCDHLGTPMEMTDGQGNIAWEASYKAWGEAKITISEAARKAGLRNPIRFQGQHFDEETGLHYNRFRYYEPATGRFISKDPIRLAGGIHLQQYAVNPIMWFDPLGLIAQRSLPPPINASEISGRSRTQIRDLATRKGLVPVKQDVAGKDVKWKCPVDGKQRLRLDRGHTDLTTGLPYDDKKAAVDHVHAYEADGLKKIRASGAQNPHFPTTGE